jgi:hypothetical protein
MAKKQNKVNWIAEKALNQIEFLNSMFIFIGKENPKQQEQLTNKKCKQ